MNNDLINREALKRVIRIECNPYGAPTIEYESGKRVLELIDRAPAFDITARPKGEWIGQGVKRCSRCDWLIASEDLWQYNFCPNCGSDMRGGDT